MLHRLYHLFVPNDWYGEGEGEGVNMDYCFIRIFVIGAQNNLQQSRQLWNILQFFVFPCLRTHNSLNNGKEKVYSTQLCSYLLLLLFIFILFFSFFPVTRKSNMGQGQTDEFMLWMESKYCLHEKLTTFIIWGTFLAHYSDIYALGRQVRYLDRNNLIIGVLIMICMNVSILED